VVDSLGAPFVAEAVRACEPSVVPFAWVSMRFAAEALAVGVRVASDFASGASGCVAVGVPSASLGAAADSAVEALVGVFVVGAAVFRVEGLLPASLVA
jgi:hypothetical protein